MKATILRGAHDVHVAEVADPVIVDATDAVVRVALAAVCGTDLWPYRGLAPFSPGERMGHEWLGVVEDVGAEVGRIRRGDLVVAPFGFSDGTCPQCREGVYTSCRRGGFWGGANDGGQAEALRVPFADATLVEVRAATDAGADDELLRRLLPLTDVMSTGHHVAVLAGIAPGATVAVIGDGAVGLCAVLAARRAGAERIVLLGHHADRWPLAKRLGATDTVDAADPRVAPALVEFTGGGVPAVCECVGTQGSFDLALALVRPGGTIGAVGVPVGVRHVDLNALFKANVTLRPGVAPVRRYLDRLVPEVLSGALDPSPVLTAAFGLDEVAAAYAAMDRRETIKSTVRPA